MSVTQGVGAMNDSEVTEFIKNSRVGVLNLVDGDKAYGVPVEHYYDGKSLLIAVSAREGQRKIECIKKNPNASFTIYESRREKPEIVKKGIRCRSVIIEGKIRLDSIKELPAKDGTMAKVQMLRLNIKKIGNWYCPRKSCDYQSAWFDRYPSLIGK
jgi:nitroimidazol reductase NimA-like FMN-containing flavoprotein (pyridoxamine 5'-phosphate oxidase superfamily)